VRVAYPGAGAAWGDQYIPRIGQEVTVSFLENDIDRPLVTGVVYNGTHRPPTFSGAGTLPANKTLSGHKSKEYKGSRYNELLFDDSTGEIRTKLSTEHGKTQLNQGFLIHPRTEGKGEPRGEGFELRTDNHGAIRAAQGLFLTTEAQSGATGKQIARDHAQTQADAALELAKSLGEVATKQLADTIEHGPETISLFVNGVKDKISLKLIAAQGKVQMQAQHGEFEITAERDITLTACKGKVTMAAKEEILLTSGGGYIRIKGGNIEIRCPDVVSMKAASHQWTGPQSLSTAMNSWPETTFDKDVTRMIEDPNNADGQLTRDELLQRLGLPEVREKLKRTLCKFPSELDQDRIEEHWGWLRNDPEYELGEKYDEFAAHIKALTIPWEEKTKLPDSVWHLQSKEFITAWRKCGWLSENEFKQLLPSHAIRTGTYRDTHNNERTGVLWEDVRTNLGNPRATIPPHRISLNKTLRKYGLNSPMRMVAFFGNSVQETSWLSSFVEGSGNSAWYAPWYGRGLLQLTHPENYINYWRWAGTHGSGSPKDHAQYGRQSST